MKKIIFTMLMSFCLVGAYAQLKVYSSGKTVVGPNGAVATPAGTVHVVRALNEASQAIYADAPASATDFTNTFSSLYLSNSNATNNNYSRLNFGDGDAAAVAAVASRIENHANNGGSLEFWTRPNAGGSITQRMVITNTGNVGIGFSAPGEKFSVNGSASKPGGGSWIVPSDETLKKDIAEFKDGLEQILKINPVTFKYNGKGGILDTESEYVGVLAQEIQEVAPYTVKNVVMSVSKLEEVATKNDRSIESTSVTNENYLQFDPNALTYMLINAVKEQQKIIEEKDAKLEDLNLQVQEMQTQLTRVLDLVEGINAGDVKVGVIKSLVEIKGQDLASLSQNRPNPFNGVTVIDYEVPTSAKQAQLNFYNPNGQLVKTVSLDHTGVGEITFRATEVASGTYSYTLVVDGNQVSTKTMVLTN